MSVKKPPAISSTRAASRSAASSLTGRSTQDAGPAAVDPDEAEETGNADEIYKQTIARLQKKKPDVSKPRQFRLSESLVEEMGEACETIGCNYSEFVRSALALYLAKLRDDGIIK